MIVFFVVTLLMLFEEPDHLLHANLKKIQSELSGSEQNYADKESRRSFLKEKMESLQRDLTAKAVLKGQYQAEKEVPYIGWIVKDFSLFQGKRISPRKVDSVSK